MNKNIEYSSRWIKALLPLQPKPIRIFCFPYAGGGAAVFRSWSTILSSTVELYAVELPGRGRRFPETFVTHFHTVIREISSSISPYLDKPYILFGHSLGALLAFEVARHLKQEGQQEPLHLIVSGRGAPHWQNNLSQISNLPDEQISTLPDAKFINAICRYNGIPKAILTDPEVLTIFLPILRADFTLLEGYEYNSGPRLSYPITVYGGTEDKHHTLDSLEAWRQLTDGPFNLKFFDGDHFFLQSQQMALCTDIKRLIKNLNFYHAQDISTT